MKYSGFPTTTRLFIPDAVAGSDALQPTSGGDLNLPQAVGQYTPGSGALVLVRVPGADATGAGGFAVAPPQGSGPVTLNSVSEVVLTNGSGYAVYEVAAANPNVQESAQFPTFVALPRVTAPAIAQETIALAPVSSVDYRFGHRAHPALRRRQGAERLQSAGRLRGSGCPAAQTLPGSHAHPHQRDRRRWRDDQRSAAASRFTIPGPAIWTGASPSFTRGAPAGWPSIRASGTNGATVKVTANTKTLTAGFSLATIIVNGGTAGSQSIAVILNVTAPPPPPPVTPSVIVSQVLNAATLQVAPLVAGSLATLMGSHLAGKIVAVTFDGIAGTLIYTSDTQINLQVPAALRLQELRQPGGDGRWREQHATWSSRSPPAWPAVFAHGIFNQDNRENTPSAAAKSGRHPADLRYGNPETRHGQRTNRRPEESGPALRR